MKKLRDLFGRGESQPVGFFSMFPNGKNIEVTPLSIQAFKATLFDFEQVMKENPRMTTMIDLYPDTVIDFLRALEEKGEKELVLQALDVPGLIGRLASDAGPQSGLTGFVMSKKFTPDEKLAIFGADTNRFHSLAQYFISGSSTNRILNDIKENWPADKRAALLKMDGVVSSLWHNRVSYETLMELADTLPSGDQGDVRDKIQDLRDLYSGLSTPKDQGNILTPPKAL